MSKKEMTIRHMVCWVLFIGYEIAYLYFTVGLAASFWHFLVYYALNILLFYFNAHVLLNFAFFGTARPYFFAIFLVILELVAYLAVKFVLDFLIGRSHYTPIYHSKIVYQYLVTNIWRGIYFIGFSTAYWSMLYMIRFKEKNHLMETEQLKTIAHNFELENKYISVENAYLQNQISPHLLFNTLNFIYNNVYQISEKAGRSVMLLSDLMRYSLVESEVERTVPLTDELEQLQNLVNLAKLRFNDLVYLSLSKKGKLSGIMIIPLVLLTLVENMMKHGDLGDSGQPGSITIQHQGQQFIFETRNKKRTSSPYPKGGLGLKNIEKRLTNHYHDRYTLNIADTSHEFIVLLKLDL